jgi:hypothetical protein
MIQRCVSSQLEDLFPAAETDETEEQQQPALLNLVLSEF